MTKNMGKTDKTIRIIAAIVIAILILVGALTGVWAWILGIIAVVFAVTSAISFCPLYTIFGISTAPKEEKKEEKK
jgi:fatty acid desaturase